MELIWYIPAEFWEISMLQDPTMSPEDAKAMTDILKGYELFAAVQGDIGPFGGVSYISKQDLRNNFEVQYSGKKLELFPKDSYSPDLQNFISMMEPMLANMFGPMGENMHFFVFRSGEPIKLSEKGEMQIKLGEFQKSVPFPLSSIMKEKKCPNDGDLLSGNWTYCPFHGEKLQQT